jgi:PAS domain S-box-containing protein
MENKKNSQPDSIFDNEDRYKLFVELSSEGIWRFEFNDKSGLDISLPIQQQMEVFFEKFILAECNDVMAKMYGFANKDEIVGIGLKEIMPPNENIEFATHFIKSNYRLTDVETVEQDNNGQLKYFLNNLIGLVKDGKLYGAWGTQRDITERKKYEEALMTMNEELIKKNEQLLKVNNDMDNFIFSVSHDLNSPLSNIEGLINVLKLNDCYKEEEPKLMMDMMDVAVARFKKTIKNLAEIARSSVSPETHSEEINISDVLEDVKFFVKDLINSSDPEINGDFSLCETMNVKKSTVHSILFNLLSNSLKYRHPKRKPEIFVKSFKENDFTILEVSDNGLGIPENEQSQIFNMFKRLHSHVEGTGVGLYIIKRIAESSGGRIEVESMVDKGSSFKVYLKTES